MPTATVNGTDICYADSGGTGPAVLLSHGFLMDHTMFDPQVAALAPEFRIITWDARAFGGTRAAGSFSYWDGAADALGLLDQCEQQVNRLHLLIAIAARDLLHHLESFLGLYCEFVKSCSHVEILCFQRRTLEGRTAFGPGASAAGPYSHGRGFAALKETLTHRLAVPPSPRRRRLKPMPENS